MEHPAYRGFFSVASQEGMGIYEADRSDGIEPEGHNSREYSTTDEEAEGRFSWAVQPDKFMTADRLAPPLVTLTVGPDAKQFSVLKNVLIQNSFFARCLDKDRYQEGATDSINMPEDDPKLMVYILRFLHTCRFDEANFRAEGALSCQDVITRLIRLFALADKYLVKKLCHELIELLRQILDGAFPAWNHLSLIKDIGLQNTAFWHTFLEEIIRWAAAWPKGWDLEDIVP